MEFLYIILRPLCQSTSALPEKCRITLKIVTTNDYIACNDKFQEYTGCMAIWVVESQAQEY